MNSPGKGETEQQRYYCELMHKNPSNSGKEQQKQQEASLSARFEPFVPTPAHAGDSLPAAAPTALSWGTLGLLGQF